MNRSLLISLASVAILLSIFSHSTAECVPACVEGQGICTEVPGATNSTFFCSCTTLWEGPTCNIHWNEDTRWMKVVTAYQIFTVVVFAAIMFWCLFECFVHFVLSKGQGWKKWSIVSYSVILTGCGAFIRVLSFSIDPHSIRGILPLPAYQILYSLPIIAWISAGFGICIFWMELNISLHRVEFVKSLRPFLITILIACWVFLIPTSVWISVKNDFASLLVYNLGIIIFLGIFLAITTIFGVKLVKQLKHSKFGSSKVFLKRIMIYMVGISIILVLVAITQVLFVFFANYSKYPYVIFHWILRTEELGGVTMFLILFTRRIPKKSSASNSHQSSPSIANSNDRKLERSGDITLTKEEEDRDVEMGDSTRINSES
eukprot:TRINITY_DN259_c0_g1_i1.p1 TRINITY_DN259_c0_g1~~TRINITY_DN259_c0_g1_i1.p1  ORF type:complete len:374 (+),score=78.86 TRINITY_DN259_c0_g1_i1:161-1282(+)